eukprot:CAMPEP_0202731128 /NCGR_PEP_ID=MMETSP1385-20130828/186988_1 /ASSEMBLY_ACC=CAM_ASM_000861 /TAXON_ID=933848 /ORGANISM="Elphidium margaritaceum" /LENGTH=215 /DNA_ID=CAMNT_0049397411 /DNA_START=745 /DNA_END=1389 /DNA_ORIENTATION=-
MMGAVNTVLSASKSYLFEDKIVELDDDARSSIMKSIEDIAGRGFHVCGFAELIESQEQYDDDPTFLTKMVFIGFAGLLNPPAGGELQSVQRCNTMDIKVALLSDDRIETARVLAEKTGILEQNKEVAKVMLETAVDEGSEEKELIEDLQEYVFNIDYYTSDKLEIVKSFQKMGKKVGVIGGDQNDLEAMKQADIAFVRGKTGAEVAKEIADVIVV